MSTSALSMNKMDKVLEQIYQGVFDKDPELKLKAFVFAKVLKCLHPKKDWYKIGKVISRKHKVQLYKES